MTDRPPTSDWGLRAPRCADELGIPPALVTDLVLRRCQLEGKVTVSALATALALHPVLVDDLVRELREKKELEVLGMVGRDYLLALTELGQRHASDRISQSRYAGAAPVCLSDYRVVCARQRMTVPVNRETLKNAFSDLVIADAMLDELGPALMTNGAVFLYGPPGTGKTSIAERLVRISPDLVLVPRAIEVDSQIISVFDSTVHIPADTQPEDLDPRWVVCQRPRVLVGGELTGDMLELTYDQSSGIYLAPLQMKANNGAMIIDDFGRQVLTPDQLLNRWIVPLDRRIDFLSLNYGVSFEVPFDVKVVLSTNLDPADLGDEAFFRRIQSKIYIGPIDDRCFDWILARAAHAMGVTVDPDAGEYIKQVCLRRGGDLRPYLPGDVCRLTKAVAAYEGVVPVLDRESVDRVLSLYYTKDPNGREQDPTAGDDAMLESEAFDPAQVPVGAVSKF
ncbi:MAG: AAA family ATPase [Acidimicrobiales bacterium]